MEPVVLLLLFLPLELLLIHPLEGGLDCEQILSLLLDKNGKGSLEALVSPPNSGFRI
jgi:hypothetical protein